MICQKEEEIDENETGYKKWGVKEKFRNSLKEKRVWEIWKVLKVFETKEISSF